MKYLTVRKVGKAVFSVHRQRKTVKNRCYIIFLKPFHGKPGAMDMLIMSYEVSIMRAPSCTHVPVCRCHDNAYYNHSRPLMHYSHERSLSASEAESQSQSQSEQVDDVTRR